MRVRTLANLILSILCVVILVASSVYIAAHWNSIPDEVPTHYNAAGEIDGYGGKGSILFLVLFGWGIYVSMVFFAVIIRWQLGHEKLPLKIAEGMLAEDVLHQLNLICCANFSYLAVQSARLQRAGAWYLPLAIIATMIPMAIFFVRCIRMRRRM